MKFYTNYWIIFLIFVPVSVFVFGRLMQNIYGEGENLFLAIFIDLLGVRGFGSYNVTWWFNKVIIILYLLFPLLYLGVRKCGWLVLVLTGLWMKFKFGYLDYISDWAFPFVVGMCCVRYQTQLEKLVNKMGRPWAIVSVAAFTLFWVVSRQITIIPYMYGIRVDGFITFGVFMLIALCPASPKVEKSMGFLGTHSSNIYMIHTFVYFYWFAPYVYSLKYSIVIFVCVMSVCLGISWLLEWLKGVTRYNKLSTLIK